MIAGVSAGFRVIAGDKEAAENAESTPSSSPNAWSPNSASTGTTRGNLWAMQSAEACGWRREAAEAVWSVQYGLADDDAAKHRAAQVVKEGLPIRLLPVTTRQR